jgi:hypothetical protein
MDRCVVKFPRGGKLVFMEQRAHGTTRIWSDPFVPLRVSKLFDLRTDPYERADETSNAYWDWIFDHFLVYVRAQRIVGEFLQIFVEFPPRQKAASFSVGLVLTKLQKGGGSH